MKIVKLTGSVPVDSPLPLWSDVFPSLISPEKVIAADTFEGTNGETINNRALPYSPSGLRQWSSEGIVLSDSAAVANATTDFRFARTPAQHDVRLHGVFSIGAGGTAGGLLFWGVDDNNWASVVIEEGRVRVRVSIAGTVDAPVVVNGGYTQGVDYSLDVTAADGRIKASVDGQPVVDFEYDPPALSAGAQVGVAIRGLDSAQARCKDIYIGQP